MPTTEGTIKKCVLRLLGTLIGAFSAWAAIRATGDNEFGLVAWITVVTFAANYISVDKDVRARLGQSKDYGYMGFYILLTQSVIVFEFVGGVGDGDDLVVDRIISNITGILMAAVLAIIPPTVMGGNPKWALRTIARTKAGVEECGRLLLGERDDALDVASLKDVYDKDVNLFRSDSQYLLEDAQRLSMFPIFQVDPNLETEIEKLTVTSSAVSILYNHIDKILYEEPETVKKLSEADSNLHSRLQRVVLGDDYSVSKNDSELPEKDDVGPSSVGGGNDRVTAIVETLESLGERIRIHKDNLHMVGRKENVAVPVANPQKKLASSINQVVRMAQKLAGTPVTGRAC